MSQSPSSESNFPENRELVVATCSKITAHGAYFTIMDYEDLGPEAGFVHISELSRTWVRNIRNVIREGQRTVARVLRVNEQRHEIDMSIRRVTDSQKRAKLQELKQDHRARSFLRIVVEKHNLSEEEVQNFERTLIDNYGSSFAALTRSREEGAEFLVSQGLPEDVSKTLYELALSELEPPTVNIIRETSVTLLEPNGIEILKKNFDEVQVAFQEKRPSSSVEISVLSAPRYRVSITEKNWKSAEKAWKELEEIIEEKFSPYDSEVIFPKE